MRGRVWPLLVTHSLLVSDCWFSLPAIHSLHCVIERQRNMICTYVFDSLTFHECYVRLLSTCHFQVSRNLRNISRLKVANLVIKHRALQCIINTLHVNSEDSSSNLDQITSYPSWSHSQPLQSLQLDAGIIQWYWLRLPSPKSISNKKMSSPKISSVKMEIVSEIISETLPTISILKKLIAWEGLIAFSSRERFNLLVYLPTLLLNLKVETALLNN
jgi:hypothetical protein